MTASHDLPQIRDTAVEEVADLMRSGGALLDIREPYEWEAGHAPSAHHVPMGQLGLHNLPEGRPILVICHVGGRSAAVTDALLRAGVAASNVAGGMAAWSAAGLPVVTDSGGPGTVI